MKLSLCSYTFNQMTKAGTMNVFGYLETCRYRYNLPATDLWNGTLDSLDKEYIAKVTDGLAERGLELANVCVDGVHIWEDDADAREANYRKALTYLDAAEAMGAKSVRIDAGGGRQDEVWTDKQFDTIVARYKEYARRAADNGYKIGPENHLGPEMAAANMKKLCEAVDSPAFGVLLHMGRWHGNAGAKGDEMVLPWVMHTHFAPSLDDAALTKAMTMLPRREVYRLLQRRSQHGSLY